MGNRRDPGRKCIVCGWPVSVDRTTKQTRKILQNGRILITRTMRCWGKHRHTYCVEKIIRGRWLKLLRWILLSWRKPPDQQKRSTAARKNQRHRRKIAKANQLARQTRRPRIFELMKDEVED